MKQFWIVLLLLACGQASFGQLSGPLSGTFGPGTYTVAGDIWINSDDSLRLLPGTTFLFGGPYSFEIYGILLAEGIESDSIIFTTYQSGTNRWWGLRFEGAASSGSRLTYCLIRKGRSFQCGAVYCNASSPTFTNCTISGNYASSGGSGGVLCAGNSSPTFSNCTISENSGSWWSSGGVLCEASSPTFSNCTISGNSATSAGGVLCAGNSSPVFTNCTISGNLPRGVYCDDSSPTFSNCTISENSAGYDAGGGVFCYRSSPAFTNSTISDNSAFSGGGGVHCDDSSPTFSNCTISENSGGWGGDGGGVYCYRSSPTFTNCTLSGNLAYNGGGVACWHNSSPIFTNCTISENSGSSGRGGGVACFESSPTFTNCTLRGNSANSYGGGVYCSSSLPTFANCTISANGAYNGGGVCCFESSPILTNCTISGNSADSGGGVYCYYDSSPTIQNCILWGNTPSQIAWSASYPSVTYSDVQGGWSGTGNIDANPIFVSGYYLSQVAAGQEQQSPCVDVGDSSSPMIEGTTRTDGAWDAGVVDMGYHYQTASAAEPPIALLPTAHVLHPNWPNPFNSSTTIRYDVPQAGQVRLTIFNLLGQEVARLVDGRQLAGTYTIAWNAGNFPSGVYLCRMEALGFAQTRKVVLVK